MRPCSINCTTGKSDVTIVSYPSWHPNMTGMTSSAWHPNMTSSAWHPNTTSSATNHTRELWKSDLSIYYSLSMMAVVLFILVVVIIVTALGNLLVFIAMFRFRNLRTVSNYLIANLAVSDFLLATTILPLSTVNECLGRWIFGSFLCNVWLVLDVLYCTASIWNLCVIAFDRFTATLYPVWYREKRSTRQAALYASLTWIVSIAICIPPLLGWNDVTQNYSYDPVYGVYQCLPFQTSSYVLYSAGGSFYIPFTITSFFYVRIFLVLRKRINKKRRESVACFSISVAEQEESEGFRHWFRESLTRGLIRSSRRNSFKKKEPSKLLYSNSTFEDDAVHHENSSHDPKHVSVVNKESEPKNGGQLETGPTVADVGRRSVLKKNFARMHAIMSRSVSIDLEANNRSRDSLTGCPASVESSSSGGEGKPNRHSKMTVEEKRKAFRKQGRTESSSQLGQRMRSEQREMRATIRMAAIIAFFCGMWIGFFVIYVVRGCCPDCVFIPRELEAFFFWLGYTNSSVNPVLYAIFNDDIRKAFQKILGFGSKTRFRSVSVIR